MAAMIQVVLRQDVGNVGKSGQLVRVRPGFARNFLLPRQLAVPATTGAIHRIEHERAVALARTDKLRKGAQDLATRLAGVELRLVHRAGDDGKLFGSVTSKEIEAAAKAKGIELDRKKIQLAEPIRALGKFDVPIRLAHDVMGTIKVEVASK